MKVLKQLLLFNKLIILFLIIFYSSNLYPQTESSGGLTMPFYGTVGQVIFQGTIVCSKTQTFLIVAGSEYPFGPCVGLNCDENLGCFCSAGNPFKNVFDVLMGTNVDTKFKKCIETPNGWNYVELEHYFQEILPIDADISYQIFARVDNSVPWAEVGRMNFTETTPLGCKGLEPCEYNQPPELHFEVIESATYTIPGTNEVVEACTTDIAGGQSGGMKMTRWHLPEGFTWNIYPCANPVNGKVKFPFKFFIEGEEENIIPYVYLTGLCENNGNYTIIESKTHMMTLIRAGHITGNDFCNLKHDICSSYGSDPNNPGYQPLIKYVLKEVVLAHEQKHGTIYEDEFQKLVSEIHSTLNDYEILCETYNLDPEEAVTEAKDLFENAFESFIYDVEGALNELGKDQIEEDILTSKEQWNLIKPYYNALDKYMKKHNIACVSIDECDRFLNAF